MSAAPRVALVFHGDREARDKTSLDEHRLGPTALALRKQGLAPEPCVYNDDFADEARNLLAQCAAALVWVNPIEQGRSRAKLDAVLKDVADGGVLVSAHPDTVLKMGTKEALFRTRGMGWGSDVRLYATFDDLRRELLLRMAAGGARVLKQYRGHSGQGVWKVAPHPSDPALVLARHAQRGCFEEVVLLDQFLESCRPYFADGGRMVDQEFQERIVDGTVRCYLVKDRVEGFGHQEVNALVPPAPGAPPEEAPQPGQRLYFPKDDARFQSLRARLEGEWLGEMQSILGVSPSELPLLWDADFMFGAGPDEYVLCEINVSSVYPYPESAMAPLASALSSLLSPPV